MTSPESPDREFESQFNRRVSCSKPHVPAAVLTWVVIATLGAIALIAGWLA